MYLCFTNVTIDSADGRGQISRAAAEDARAMPDFLCPLGDIWHSRWAYCWSTESEGKTQI